LIPSSVTLEPGELLAGKYRIERLLGQGGMGVVAAAYHIQLEQRVALKLMLPHAIGSSEAVSRFLREARAAARITSEHVVRVFDVGSLETGEPYIAMEYLEGLDIAQLLTRQGRLSVAETVDYVLQACEALAEAHAAGIVHRDLKPGNLYLAHRIDGQRLLKVLDFGVSKMSGGSAQSDAPATRTSALMGSPLYMSPEQMTSSRNVDARSDVWALGVVMYEMLCGKPPFDGETLPQVCNMVMTEAPPPLAGRASELPPRLCEVVHRCLEKQPSARFQSVGELAHALEPIASARALQSIERISRVLGMAPAAPPAVEPSASAATSAPPGTQANWGETNPALPARRKAPVVLLAVLGGLALAGVGVTWRFLAGSSAPVAAGSAPVAAGSALSQAPLLAAAPSTASAVTAPVPASPASPAPAPSAEPSSVARDVAAPAVHDASHPAKGTTGAPPAPPKPVAAKPVAAAPAAAKPAPAAPSRAPAPAPTVPPAPAPTRSRL
jgi:eukaryotic-like serine/threonine-protein kinase